MQLSRIMSAFAKNGITIEQRQNFHGLGYFIAKKDGRELEFRRNGGDSDYVTHFTLRDPQTDASVDLFMDTYYHTVKSAIHYLNPSGELVKPVKSISQGPSVQVESATVSKNEEKNGIEIRFPGKPSQDVIESLKANGYRWSSFAKVWWKPFNQEDFDKACETYMEKVQA